MKLLRTEISNKKIEETLDFFDNEGIQIHSFLASYKDSLLSEVYYSPFSDNTMHRMYSISKSITAILIGILIKQKKVSLDDDMTKFFPQYDRSKARFATVRDLLMMKTPFLSTSYKRGSKNSRNVSTYQDDYVKAFFTEVIDRRCPLFFSYDTGASVVLARIVEIASGMSYEDFLRTELYKPLGLKVQGVKVLKDRKGNPQGGSGLLMKPYDLLKIIYMLSLGGCGIIDDDFAIEAVKALSDNTITGLGNMKERRSGYGYQIWRVRNDAFAFVGLGGQYAVAVPEKELCFAVTADTMINGAYADIILRKVLELADSIDPKEYAKKKSRSVVALENRVMPKPFSGIFDCMHNQFGFERIEIKYNESIGSIVIEGNGKSDEYSFAMGRNRVVGFTEKASSPALGSAAITRDGILIVWLQFIGEWLGDMTFEIAVTDTRLSMRVRTYGELTYDGLNGALDARRIH